MGKGSMSDENVTVLLARDGHPQAFRALYDLHFEAVYRTAFRYTRSREDAEDVLQETFIKAFSNIAKFNFERNASFAAWIGRICANSALSQLRKRRTRRPLEACSLTASPQDPPSAGRSPEEEALLRQMAGSIDEALRLLSPRQQLAFRMKYIEDWKVEEIAREFGCSPNSVKKHLGRALAVLRRRLKPLWSKP
jgi:RNA polymerase sigma-70 factor (ECF subfamily)